MTLYLSKAQVLALHKRILAEFGGLAGLRDRGALEAAVERPCMTFAGHELYPDIPAKAAALMHSLVCNHPFIDGNKRVGAAAAELFARANDLTLAADDDALFDVTMALANGRVSIEELTIWFRMNLTKCG